VKAAGVEATVMVLFLEAVTMVPVTAAEETAADVTAAEEAATDGDTAAEE